jgi:hypothetical protein
MSKSTWQMIGVSLALIVAYAVIANKATGQPILGGSPPAY